jgi:dynein heavy chain, axonemal
MDGTCIETPPQAVSEDEEPVMFSFYTDISANPQVIKTVLLLNQFVHKTFNSVSKYLDGWKRYKLLWKLDKVC